MSWSKPEWNAPMGEKPAQTATPRKRVNPRLVGALAGLIVVVGALTAWFLLSPEPSPPAPEPPKVVKPKKAPKTVVRPQPVKAPPPPVEVTQTNKWPARSPHPDGEWRHGEGPRSIAVTNGCLVTYPHCPGVQLILPHPAFAPPFKTLLDNEIARILMTKPGDGFIDAPLPKNFDEKFVESTLVPIEITEDDTPEKAELKRQVLEARKMLIEAAKRGESPREILMEEVRHLRRLMQTRDNYQRIVNEQIANGASDQEIADTVNAANRMLEGEGSDAKVRLPYRMNLRLRQGKVEGRILD